MSSGACIMVEADAEKRRYLIRWLGRCTEAVKEQFEKCLQRVGEECGTDVTVHVVLEVDSLGDGTMERWLMVAGSLVVWRSKHPHAIVETRVLGVVHGGAVLLVSYGTPGYRLAAPEAEFGVLSLGGVDEEAVWMEFVLSRGAWKKRDWGRSAAIEWRQRWEVLRNARAKGLGAYRMGTANAIEWGICDNYLDT